MKPIFYDRPDNVPRLLYMGDVPIESTFGGPTVLYRLLQPYPADKLLVVESDFWPQKNPTLRLPGVAYHTIRLGLRRLNRGRIAPYYYTWLNALARHRTGQVADVIRRFRPEAVLTVAQEYTWQTAAQWAEDLGVPLHLIVHDDIASTMCLPRPVGHWANRHIKRVYRQAVTRMCVSQYVADYYSGRFGAPSSVLYPLRAADAPQFTEPAGQVGQAKGQLTFGFAGSIDSSELIAQLKDFIAILGRTGHKLFIQTWLNEQMLERAGLTAPHVTTNRILPYREVIPTLNKRCDVLLVPMSFQPHATQDMKISFPSKLADYTASGLPILIWGPPYGSAVKWAKDNPGIGEVVDSPEPAAVEAAIGRLAADPAYRVALTQSALRIGNECFSHEAVTGQLYEQLRA